MCIENWKYSANGTFTTERSDTSFAVPIAGKCKNLKQAIQGLSLNQIADRADQLQSVGDVVASSRVMCAGVCFGAMLLDPVSFANLGVLLKAQGHISAAIKCYKTSLRLDRSSAMQHYRIANAYMAQHSFGEARSAFTLATARMPRYGDAYNNLGNCLMSMARWDEAEKAYTHAVSSDPEEANYYCNLGGVVARRDVDKAIHLLRHGLTLNPAFAEVYNNLANYLRDQVGFLSRMHARAREHAKRYSRASTHAESTPTRVYTTPYLCGALADHVSDRRIDFSEEM